MAIKMISVIIPVFKAENTIREAVLSALLQPETGEILLIEDGSPDNSIDICKELESEYPIIRLLRHPNGENKGASVSRNLGITNAEFDLIAFLDADDFYFKDRFRKALDILNNNPSIDGVYDTVATIQYDDKENINTSKKRKILSSIDTELRPEELFPALIHLDHGHFHANGLLVRRRVFEKCGFFNQDLKISQDTEMWMKMAALSTLVPGNINKPVASWVIHGSNRITKIENEEWNYYRGILWDSIIKWAQDKGLDIRKKSLIQYGFLLYKSFELQREKPFLIKLALFLRELIILTLKKPFYGIRVTFIFISRITNKLFH
jgi:glycosyltransferase involved in cell wall biosynthesis